MYYNGEWGAVCPNGWDLIDAQVLCRQLGYGQAINARSYSFYGTDWSRIMLDSVNCVGTEFTIEDCSHGGWGYKFYSKDAGLKCSALNDKFVLMYSLNILPLFLSIEGSVLLVYAWTFCV